MIVVSMQVIKSSFTDLPICVLHFKYLKFFSVFLYSEFSFSFHILNFHDIVNVRKNCSWRRESGSIKNNLCIIASLFWVAVFVRHFLAPHVFWDLNTCEVLLTGELEKCWTFSHRGLLVILFKFTALLFQVFLSSTYTVFRKREDPTPDTKKKEEEMHLFYSVPHILKKFSHILSIKSLLRCKTSLWFSYV